MKQQNLLNAHGCLILALHPLLFRHPTPIGRLKAYSFIKAPLSSRLSINRSDSPARALVGRIVNGNIHVSASFHARSLPDHCL